MAEHKSENKSTWALGISVVAIILCILVFALWIFETIPHSVIQPESFIGAIIALLSVIVTIAVGAQITNVMEVKSAQKRYEEELKTALEKIQTQQKQMEGERYYNKHIQGCITGLLTEMRGDNLDAVYFYFNALLNGLQMEESFGNEKFIFSQATECIKKCKETESVPDNKKEKLKIIDTKLRSLPNYHWIKEEYGPLRDQYFKKIGL